jgi:hypothetical protein
MIKTFKLGTETVAFLFQILEYRGEISHGGILAGHRSFDYDRSTAYHMLRSLIWIESDDDETGWACSKCLWSFPVPTLLSGEAAKGAYDRLAAVKFREHQCEGETSPSAAKQETKRDADTPFAERARMLIKRGYTPRVAVDLVLQETEVEHSSDSRIMERARADAKDFSSESP